MQQKHERQYKAVSPLHELGSWPFGGVWERRRKSQRIWEWKWGNL